MGNRILVVDDESGCRNGLARLLEAWGYEAETASSGEEALDRLQALGPCSVITDLVMPGLHGPDLIRRVRRLHEVPVIVLTGQGSISAAVAAVQAGADDFLEKPVQPEALRMRLEKLERDWDTRTERRRLRYETGQFDLLRGKSKTMHAVYREIETVAPSTLTVLIVGESGTGKELVSRTLHNESMRKSREFVAVNCAAIPPTLLESEIFGHERGSFTGATQRKIGCFEMADRGTLFLDEIAEMDVLLQAKLLRVLQEQRFRRVGGTEVIKADVRVVAATNKDPVVAMAEGKLREDLYYRLNVFTIRLPALRDRRDDVPMLAEHFAQGYAERAKMDPCPITDSAMQKLIAHNWPGNVRELKNAIERAALLASDEPIRLDHLPPEVSSLQPSLLGSISSRDADQATVMLPVGVTMEETEREMIRSTLRHTEGNKTRAAKMLDISLKTMHNKVKKYGL